MKLKIVVSVFIYLVLTGPLYGQKSQTVDRKGLVIGLALGRATSRLDFPLRTQNDTDLALGLKVGYMLRSDLALLLTSNIAIYDYSGFGRDRKRDFGILALSVQYWLNYRFWIQGGIGLGGDNPVFWDIKNPDDDSLETKYYFGLGYAFSLGFEVYQSQNNFTFDVKLRTMYRNVELQEGSTSGFTYGILFGCNFY